MQSSNSVSIIVVGCGSRGEVYASYALKHPKRAQIVGLCDPRIHSIKKLLKIYELTVQKEKIFSDWKEIVKLDHKLADCVLICLPDKLHREAAVELTKKGYHILLEKPMATSLDDCIDITKVSRSMPSQINAVCHVLRYFAPCIKLKQLIDSGLIGDVVNINHTEPIGYWHFAHSFVRGNWHNESESSFSLLAKCCHDIDLLVYWMGSKKKCVKVSSFGSLKHFRPENAPKGSSDNCFSCPVEQDCCYSTKKLYMNPKWKPGEWPSSVVLSSEINHIRNDGQDIDDIENFFLNKSDSEKFDLLEKCLKNEQTTKYGRCVYKMDNDVCDNQVVNMLFDDNSTASLTMIAFSKDTCTRKTRIYGTKGELEWDDSLNHEKINHYDFLTRTSNQIDCSDARPTKIRNENESIETKNEHIKLSGHGGSDYWLMDSFIEAILKNDKSMILTDVEDSFRSHLIVFAAEYSRIKNVIVDVNEFCKTNNISV